MIITFSVFKILKHQKYIVNNNDVNNSTLDTKTIKETTEDIVVLNKSIYNVYPSKGDYIGTMSIPVLNEIFSIYEGTESEELEKGVEHFIQSTLPGENDNSVISGHNDTAFSNLGKVNVGDDILIETSAGKFTYEVIQIRIVEKDDKTVIVPTKGAMLTLTTCYPFDYVGFPPQRYIVQAEMIYSTVN